MTEVPRIELAPGYTISRLLKGGWHLAGGHGAVERQAAIGDMAAFVEAGITTFDCADHYTAVEELIGDFRAAHPALARRNEVHTKFVPDYDRLARVDRAYVGGIINRSLRRLRMERLDLVQFHWWDTGTPGFVETALILQELKQAGKIARIGTTNFNTARLGELVEAGVELVANQPQYSPIDLRPEGGLIAFCQDRGIRQLCYGTLAGGFFAADWLGKPEPHEPFANRSLTKYKLIIEDFGGWDLFQDLLRALDRIAAKHAVSIPLVALRWVLDRPGIAGAIVGATSARHLAENLRVFSFQLDDEDELAIRTVTDRRTGPEGDCYDLERDKEGRHGRIMRYNQNVAG
ncbi:MAG: aldo/keto reductase [Inquilinus sp.]|nr:aldo/keto reductase [Inquilinus sp.]